MTPQAPGHHASYDNLKWLTLLVFVAGVYNLAWGACAVANAEQMLAWYGLPNAQPLALWQCIGMLVGVYGVAYLLASRNLHQFWPIVLVGLLGKVLGPIGAIVGICTGQLPSQFLWVNISNDLIWIPGFVWVLWYTRSANNPTTATSHSADLSLYQRVLGARFSDLSPHLRRFHAAQEVIRVEGAFAVQRGPSALGNRLTDLSGFPRTEHDLPVSLQVTPSPRGESWLRVFGGHTIASWQEQRAGLFVENFGWLRMYLVADVQEGALVVRDLYTTFFGVPLPPPLSPKVDAFGRDEGEHIAVRIRITNPALGLLVSYSGKIRIV